MSFAKREMQVETSPRLLAWAMHLSNEVKTVVLRSTNVPTRTANTMEMASARMPQISPAAACPELVASLVLLRAMAIRPRTIATSRARGNKTNDIEATRLATPSAVSSNVCPLDDAAESFGKHAGCRHGDPRRRAIAMIVDLA
jgi:hypothetical protein